MTVGEKVTKRGKGRGWWTSQQLSLSSTLFIFALYCFVGYFRGGEEIFVTIRILGSDVLMDISPPEKELLELTIERNKNINYRPEMVSLVSHHMGNVSELFDYEDVATLESSIASSTSFSGDSVVKRMEHSKWQRGIKTNEIRLEKPAPLPFDEIDLDYSSFEKGGRVFIHERGWRSEDISLPYTSQFYRFGQFLYTKNPSFHHFRANIDSSVVIRNSNEYDVPKIGDCYPIPGSEGAITVKLTGGPIIARQFLLTHVFNGEDASSLVSTQKNTIDSTAPVNFTIFGWTDVPRSRGPSFKRIKTSGERIELGTFTYNVYDKQTPTQVY